jgi:Spy/CpxP family protein refolding chaperone
MKRLTLFLLLISLGLNFGLGMRMYQARKSMPPWAEGKGMAPRSEEGQRWNRRPGRGGHQRQAMFEDLNLSDDQQSQLTAMRDEHREDMFEQRQHIGEVRQELRTLLQAKVLDRERIAAIRSHHGHEQARLDSLVTERLLQELEILTPEQRERYLDHMPGRGWGPQMSR